MMAAQVQQFGPPTVLGWQEVPRPTSGPGQVLIAVQAAGVNPPDWYMRSGFAEIPADLRPPVELPFIPGWDVSGIVVDVGPGVTAWAAGDEVFGMLGFPPTSAPRTGQAYAQYTVAASTDLARKPAGLDHRIAAALPMSGLTAYQYVHDHANVQPGQRVLVVGAAGGVGHLILQLAKIRGAHVTAAASTRHAEFLTSLGADEVVDYTRADVGQQVRNIDVVFDTVGGPNGHQLLPALRDGAILAPVFMGDYRLDEAARRGIVQRFGQVHTDTDQLTRLGELAVEHRMRVAIENTYPLPDAWKAHERAEQGHLQGKLVLVADDVALLR
jgi:NADPH:quinone reductase-like Zn-dependent oxidoreductase